MQQRPATTVRFTTLILAETQEACTKHAQTVAQTELAQFQLAHKIHTEVVLEGTHIGLIPAELKEDWRKIADLELAAQDNVF